MNPLRIPATTPANAHPAQVAGDPPANPPQLPSDDEPLRRSDRGPPHSQRHAGGAGRDEHRVRRRCHDPVMGLPHRPCDGSGDRSTRREAKDVRERPTWTTDRVRLQRVRPPWLPSATSGPRSGSTRSRSSQHRPRSDLQPPAECLEAVGHPLQSGAAGDRGRVESGAIVGHDERQPAVRRIEAHVRRRRRRVLRHVLEGLETAEVRGGLDLLPVPLDPVRMHLHRDRRAPDLSLQRGGESPIGQDRRVDPRARSRSVSRASTVSACASVNTLRAL